MLTHLFFRFVFLGIVSCAVNRIHIKDVHNEILTDEFSGEILLHFDENEDGNHKNIYNLKSTVKNRKISMEFETNFKYNENNPQDFKNLNEAFAKHFTETLVKNGFEIKSAELQELKISPIEFNDLTQFKVSLDCAKIIDNDVECKSIIKFLEHDFSFTDVLINFQAISLTQPIDIGK